MKDKPVVMAFWKEMWLGVLVHNKAIKESLEENE